MTSSFDLNFLTEPVFWTAVGVFVAVAALLVNLLKGTHWRYIALQRRLKKERNFYDTFPNTRQPPDPQSQPVLTQDSLKQLYLNAVDRGLSGVEVLPVENRRKVSSELRDLISELQRTHQTLVDALELFSLLDAKAFFEGWRSAKSELSRKYHGGTIASDAHTHCSAVVNTVLDLCSQIPEEAPGYRRIEEITRSVISQDWEVIVPVMTSILERSQLELDLIAHSIEKGDKRRAIQLKEKYWFDAQHDYQTIRNSLDKMRRLSNEIDTTVSK
jgi:hypothetical protein